MRHATIELGGYLVPLIGVPRDATSEACDGCLRRFPLLKVTFDGGEFLCPGCLLKRKNPATLPGSALTVRWIAG